MTAKKSRLPLFLSLLVGLVVLATIIGYVMLGTAVKKGVNRFAPELTGTPVTLANASLSPLTGSGELTGLFVGNPAGWTGDKLAYLGKIHVDVAPMSLLGDTIVVRDITIEQPEFVYETRLVSSNLKALTDHIESVVGAGPGTTPATSSGPAKKIAVQSFVLRDAKVSLIAAGTTLELPLPTIELHDLGTPENGLTPSQLALAVSKQLLQDIAAATASVVADGRLNLNNASDAVNKVGDTLKGLFGGKKDPEPRP
ncbi:hypothetical protein [Synoicihabitans lomoniglobus]|uniref:AsmA family protein n=1 Tax=Synoicihabitans lomoniglobus TaxID=2909285 RepID=A0AAF0CMZ5_9BACT|nr:hypothetical protein [Opitutaceae bacterium LMO-M01]WED64818.1 hypothetical protein PXH66_20935 [Opitutaceae bacterium LMO-M01]